MKRPLPKTQLLGLAVSLFCGTAPVLSAETTAWRLFVADHTAPHVTALDAATGESLGVFQLDAPATLYATKSQAGVFAVQGAGNKVSAIATGIALDDHGDHGDLHLSAPALVAGALEGERPVHFVEHDGHLAVFFDGSGTVRLVDEADWLAGTIESHDHVAAAPHHGVALAVGAHLVISEPNATDPKALPVGVRVLDADGKSIGGVHDCPDLHGEATSGKLVAIACATGLLLVTPGAEGPVITHLPYGPDLPEGKSTTLLGGVGLQYFLGNFGANRVVIIEPEAATPFRLVDLPARRVHFAVDPQRPRFAYVFTEDGALHELDIVAGALTRSLALTEPYSMDGEWSLPRPRIAVAGSTIAVTDPLQGRILLVDSAGFAQTAERSVEGLPFSIVAVGGSGADH